LDASLSQIHDPIDMFTELPCLMDDALSTCLEYSGDTDDARIQEGTRRKLGGLVGRLEKWLDAWDSENPAASFEVPADSDMTHSWDSDGPLFSHVIHYADLDSAYALCMYRAIYICATEWQHVLNKEDRAGIRDLPQVQRMALDICRSVDYNLLPKNIRSGSWYIIFPARVAYYALSQTSRQSRWIAGVLENTATNTAAEVSRKILHDIPLPPGSSLSNLGKSNTEDK
jgi:hypothetical protein